MNPQEPANEARRLNVWIVNQCAAAPTEAGITRHYSLARELIARGHRVTVIATSFDHLTRQEMRLAPGERSRLEVVEGVPFLWLRTPPYRGNTPARFWNMAVFARRVLADVDVARLGKPDVVLGSSPPLFGALAAQALARRHRVPFVLEVRDLWPQTLIDVGKMSPLHPVVGMFGAIERHLYRQADRIVVLLPGAAEHLTEKGARLEKLVWLPNGLDMSLFPPPSPVPAGGPFTVMYAGAHGLANGLDAVLDAAARLREQGLPVRFRLVGDGPEKPRLQARAQAEGLDNVGFEAPVPKTEIYRVLAEADAFLMVLKSSRVFQYGVSPNKLFDYMGSARPVIFSVNSPFNPIHDEDGGLSVPPDDPVAIAEAIAWLHRLPAEERFAMGLRGRRYVERRHDYRLLSERLEQVLLQAVRGVPASSLSPAVAA